MPVKTPTQWRRPSGTGYIINAGDLFIVTNLSDFIVTNTGDYLITTPTYGVPKYPTSWLETGV